MSCQATVPDNGNLSPSSDLDLSWVFYNSESSQSSATDGSQHTDYEPLAPSFVLFTINIPVVDTNNFYKAYFLFNVSGSEATLYGERSLYLDGHNYSSYLPL